MDSHHESRERKSNVIIVQSSSAQTVIEANECLRMRAVIEVARLKANRS